MAGRGALHQEESHATHPGTIQTFLGYLAQDMATADAGRVAKDIDFIRLAANKMSRLLDDLLEISRIGRIVSLPVRVTLGELVDDALAVVAGRIAERGMVVQVDDREVTLYGDRVRLAQVLLNLLDNASKFMGDQQAPRIEVGVEMRAGEATFFVRDNGIGIDRVSWGDSKVFINLSREAIKQSPEYTEASLLTRDYETGLHRHYKRQGYWADELAAKEHPR